ncbi:hypothetical protein BH23ACT1_BH23ACT1_02320 [soil metagenome]
MAGRGLWRRLGTVVGDRDRDHHASGLTTMWDRFLGAQTAWPITAGILGSAALMGGAIVVVSRRRRAARP